MFFAGVDHQAPNDVPLSEGPIPLTFYCSRIKSDFLYSSLDICSWKRVPPSKPSVKVEQLNPTST